MLFVFGVIDKSSGRRRVISGDARPSVAHLTELTANLSDRAADWGPSASPRSAQRTASLILNCVVDTHTARALSRRFADEVIRSMSDNKMWLIPFSEITEWLTEKMIDRSVCMKVAA